MLYCLAYRFKKDFEYRRLITGDIQFIKCLTARWKPITRDLYIWAVQDDASTILQPLNDLPTALVYKWDHYHFTEINELNKEIYT